MNEVIYWHVGYWCGLAVAWGLVVLGRRWQVTRREGGTDRG